MGECMAWRCDRSDNRSQEIGGGGVAYLVELKTDRDREVVARIVSRGIVTADLVSLA